MNAKILFFIAILTNFTCTITNTYKPESWKVLFYMDSSDDLNDMAIKNITNMIRVQPNDNITFYVQLHAYDQAALRYKLTKSGLTFIEESTLSNNCKLDLLNAASWAFSNNNSDHTMLILSNHGWGILDPLWNDITGEWEASGDGLSNSCMIKKMHKNHKGYMFNVNPKVYLNNQDLIDGLATINNSILNDKQLDILAFDTCMGGMLEVAYQVAPYAKYLVGSQSCSLRDGFDYQNIIHALNQGPNPFTLARNMITIFNNYYNKYDDSGVYTHTALDLSYAQVINISLNNVLSQILILPNATELFKQARESCPRFCLWPMYTDLIAVLKFIDAKLIDNSPEIILIKQAIQDLYIINEQFIVARCGGHSTKDKAHGFAIYLPEKLIDNSYYKTIFAQNSKWIDVLKLICDK